MAVAEPTQHAPTPEERGVDARLADALDHLLGALDHLPAKQDGDEARLSYGGGRVPSWWKLLGFLYSHGLRLRYSQRLPYRIPRLVAVWFACGCVIAGAMIVLLRFVTL